MKLGYKTLPLPSQNTITESLLKDISRTLNNYNRSSDTFFLTRFLSGSLLSGDHRIPSVAQVAHCPLNSIREFSSNSILDLPFVKQLSHDISSSLKIHYLKGKLADTARFGSQTRLYAIRAQYLDKEKLIYLTIAVVDKTQHGVHQHIQHIQRCLCASSQEVIDILSERIRPVRDPLSSRDVIIQQLLNSDPRDIEFPESYQLCSPEFRDHPDKEMIHFAFETYHHLKSITKDKVYQLLLPKKILFSLYLSDQYFLATDAKQSISTAVLQKDKLLPHLLIVLSAYQELLSLAADSVIRSDNLDRFPLLTHLYDHHQRIVSFIHSKNTRSTGSKTSMIFRFIQTLDLKNTIPSDLLTPPIHRFTKRIIQHYLPESSRYYRDLIGQTDRASDAHPVLHILPANSNHFVNVEPGYLTRSMMSDFVPNPELGNVIYDTLLACDIIDSSGYRIVSRAVLDQSYAYLRDNIHVPSPLFDRIRNLSIRSRHTFRPLSTETPVHTDKPLFSQPFLFLSTLLILTCATQFTAIYWHFTGLYNLESGISQAFFNQDTDRINDLMETYGQTLSWDQRLKNNETFLEFAIGNTLPKSVYNTKFPAQPSLDYTQNGETPLTKAVRANNIAAFQMIFNVQPHHQTDMTALKQALDQGDDHIIAYFLYRPINWKTLTFTQKKRLIAVQNKWRFHPFDPSKPRTFTGRFK